MWSSIRRAPRPLGWLEGGWDFQLQQFWCQLHQFWDPPGLDGTVTVLECEHEHEARGASAHDLPQTQDMTHSLLRYHVLMQYDMTDMMIRCER